MVPTAVSTALDIDLSNISLVFITVSFSTMVSNSVCIEFQTWSVVYLNIYVIYLENGGVFTICSRFQVRGRFKSQCNAVRFVNNHLGGLVGQVWSSYIPPSFCVCFQVSMRFSPELGALLKYRGFS